MRYKDFINFTKILMETEEFILAKTAEFISSEDWWGPIIKFMYKNADKFKTDGYTAEKYQIFLQFSEIVCNLFDNSVSKYAHISDNSLEWTLLSCVKSLKIQALVIADILQKTLSFEEFYKQMKTINNNIDYDISLVLKQFEDQLKNPDVDKDKLAILFSQVVARAQNERIKHVIEDSCKNTKDLVKVSPRNKRHHTRYLNNTRKSPKKENQPPKIPSDLEKQIEETLNDHYTPAPPTTEKNGNPHRNFNKSKKPDMSEEIEKRREFYRQQREKMRNLKTTPVQNLEKSNLPKLIKNRQYFGNSSNLPPIL